MAHTLDTKWKSSWVSTDWKTFGPGDIICNEDKQDFTRLIVFKDDIAIYCVGLTHCALTEQNERHPIFPIYFNEIEKMEELLGDRLLKLGSLSDYGRFIQRVDGEAKALSAKMHEIGE